MSYIKEDLDCFDEIRRCDIHELEISYTNFREIDGKYYLGTQLINDLIEQNNINKLIVSFYQIDDLNNNFFKQISPKIVKIFLKDYNNPIDNFPDNITYLEIDTMSHPINKLPKSLIYLHLHPRCTNFKAEYPEKLKFFIYSNNTILNINNLPSNLIYLDIDEIENVNNLSNNIIILKIKSDISVDKLPSSIKYLTLGNQYKESGKTTFNKPVDNLPNRIIKLEFGYNFNQTIDNLPNSLKYLILGNEFNQKIDNLPNSLEYLKLGNNFNQTIDNLPNSLKYLILGKDFNQTINNLPNFIESISFDNHYTLPLSNLPDNLKSIKIYYNRRQVDDAVELIFWEPITVNYKIGLKKIDFINSSPSKRYDLNFNLKINDQINNFNINKSQKYSYDYNDKKIYVNIVHKPRTSRYHGNSYSVQFKLKDK